MKLIIGKTEKNVGGDLVMSKGPFLVLQTKAAYVLFYQRRDDDCYRASALTSLPSCSEGGVRLSSSQQGVGDEEAYSMDTN